MFVYSAQSSTYKRTLLIISLTELKVAAGKNPNYESSEYDWVASCQHLEPLLRLTSPSHAAPITSHVLKAQCGGTLRYEPARSFYSARGGFPRLVHTLLDCKLLLPGKKCLRRAICG